GQPQVRGESLPELPVISTRLLHATATCLLLVAQGGCATLIHGTTQRIPIVAPGPVAVDVDGIPAAIGPKGITVSRRSSHFVRITKDSAPAVEVELER